MTELLSRPTASTPTDVEAAVGPSVWWRGALGALWAICVGVGVLVVVVLIVWATDARSGADASDAMRAALQLWLVAHKVPLHTAAGTVGIAPLGLTLVLALLLGRAGAVLARACDVDSAAGVGVVAAAIAVPYAVVCAFVAAAADSGSVRPSPVAALGAGLLLSGAAASWGAMRGASPGVLTAAVPERFRGPMSAGMGALPVLFGAGLALVLGSLAAHAHTASTLADQLGGGVVAAAALLLLDALLLPNAALAAVGYVVGPGFALGAGTGYTQSGVTATTLPSLPLLAAAPHGAAPLSVRLVCLLGMLLAGGYVGWRLLPLRASGWSAVQAVLLAAATAGVAVAVAVGVAGGPGGPGRMAVVGASPWQVGLAVAGEIAALAAVVVAVGTRAGWRANR